MLELLQKTASQEAHAAIAEVRKGLAGSGMRGDKIRTYMFQHGKVTDHLTGKSAPADKVMAGNFNLLWN